MYKTTHTFDTDNACGNAHCNLNCNEYDGHAHDTGTDHCSVTWVGHETAKGIYTDTGTCTGVSSDPDTDTDTDADTGTETGTHTETDTDTDADIDAGHVDGDANDIANETADCTDDENGTDHADELGDADIARHDGANDVRQTPRLEVWWCGIVRFCRVSAANKTWARAAVCVFYMFVHAGPFWEGLALSPFGPLNGLLVRQSHLHCGQRVHMGRRARGERIACRASTAGDRS